MRQIPLTQGRFALVDDEDYDELVSSKWKWFAAKVNSDTRYFYAYRAVSIGGGKQSRQAMHRLLLSARNGEVVDHIDHNGLNNQRSNLRKCSSKENGRNLTSHKGAASKFLGVFKQTQKWKTGKGGQATYWVAGIKAGGKSRSLGSFPFTSEGEISAAKRYDEHARVHFGEFANCNFK